MEPIQSNYPGKLFNQPDFELLFKYFPDNTFPTLPGLDCNGKPVHFIGGDYLERQAFWDGIKDPYNTRLVEQRHDVNFYVKRWKLTGYAENEVGDLNGILVWDPKPPKNEALQDVWDMPNRYFNTGKDFSSELFAIHWWLKLHVQNEIDPIRRIPFLPKDQLVFWESNESSLNVKAQLEKKLKKDIDILRKELEIESKFTSKTKEEIQKVVDRLKIVKEFDNRSSLKRVSEIRQKLCRQVFDFLNNERVCKSITGIQMIGAFLIFSSGLSFNDLSRKPNLEFDLEFDKKFEQCLSSSKSEG